MEIIQENGLEGLSKMIRVMVNQAMQFERENFLNARSYERSQDRTGYTNGYKPETVNTMPHDMLIHAKRNRQPYGNPNDIKRPI